MVVLVNCYVELYVVVELSFTTFVRLSSVTFSVISVDILFTATFNLSTLIVPMRLPPPLSLIRKVVVVCYS